MKFSLKKIIFIILTIPFLGLMIFVGRFMFSEGINPINRAIDTQFTTEYDDEKFNLIKTGMDSLDVKKLIGTPFGVRKLTDNKTLWYFSGDGKCSWYDFAWLGREIQFDKNGKVIKIIKQIYYD